MEKYLFEHNLLCPNCEKGNVYEVFVLPKDKNTSSSEMLIGVVNLRNYTVRDIHSQGCFCKKCSVMLWPGIAPSLNDEDAKKVLCGLLSRNTKLDKDICICIEIPNGKAKMFRKGQEVFMYEEYPSNINTISIADRIPSTTYISESLDGPFYEKNIFHEKVFESSQPSDFNPESGKVIKCDALEPITFSYSLEDGNLFIDGKAFGLKDTRIKDRKMISQEFSLKCEIFTEGDKKISHVSFMRYLLLNQSLIPASWISKTSYYESSQGYNHHRKYKDGLNYMPIVLDSVWILSDRGISCPAMIYNSKKKMWFESRFWVMPAHGPIEIG